MKRWFFIGQFSTLALLCANAQDYTWWNQKHNWDGTTHWSEYLILSPAFLGPNALPVQEILTGEIPGESSFTFALDGHFAKGDRTGNLFTKLYFPLFSDRAALGIAYVPVEFYRTDTLIRDLRRSREEDARGVSFGDVYFTTYIQLVKGHPVIPDILFSVNIKTASGTAMEAARHTNGPGYYFDLSVGKEIPLKGNGTRFLRPYLLAGFFAYQTNQNDYMQDDAVTYGAGCDLNVGRFQLGNQLGGYRGYLDNGDRPLIYRLVMQWRGGSGIAYGARLQHGIADFPFTSVRISTVYNFSNN